MKNIKVLIVDDEPLIGQLVVNILRRMNFSAEDITYHEVLDEALRDIPLFPKLHLVITDWNIPHGNDGAKVIECARVKFPSVQIIAMTGMVGNMDAITKSSPDAFLPKPFQIEECQLAIHACLQRIMASSAAA